MTEYNYTCSLCGDSIYRHDNYGSEPFRFYSCGDKLIWHNSYLPPQIFIPEKEVQDLKEELADLHAKYASLVLQTTGFLDSLVDPVEEFVAVLAGEVTEEDFYANFYEEDEDPAEIHQAYSNGIKGLTESEEKEEVLLPKDGS